MVENENQEMDDSVYEHCTPLFDESYWCLLSRGLHGYRRPPPAVAPPPIPAISAGKYGAAADDNGRAAGHDNRYQPKIAAATNPADPAGAAGGGEDPAVAEPVKNEDANPTRRIRHQRRSPPRYIGTRSMAESSSRRPRGRPPNPSGRRTSTGCFQLPEGWIADPKARPSGRIDVVRKSLLLESYVEVSSGRRFRSRKGVMEYIVSRQVSKGGEVRDRTRVVSGLE